MTDYISRETTFKVMLNYYQIKTTFGYEMLKDIINHIPAANVRLVGTCGECAYAYPAGIEIKCTKHSGEKDKFGEDCVYSEYHNRNWFCADWMKARDNVIEVKE